MYDRQLLLAQLKRILEALSLIPGRFQSIEQPKDFLVIPIGRGHLDSICMVLLAVGESFKQIDSRTEGKLLAKYPNIPWKQIMGLRNVLAHVYFEVDEEQIFTVCEENIEPLILTVRQMIEDLKAELKDTSSQP